MNLQQLAVETFCPKVRQGSPNQCKTAKKEKEPLFPGYMFVKLDILNEFRKVSYAQGVIGIVKFGSTPALVEEEIINSIKAKSSNMAETIVIRRGQSVFVDKGPLQGIEALFDQGLNGFQRVALLLKAVSFQGRLVIDQDNLVI